MTLLNTLYNNVDKESTIMSDDYRGYKKVKHIYNHKTINHSKGNYVNGNIYTNTIEGAFGIFKRGVYGIYHHISSKYIEKYLHEFCYRYNTKDLKESERVNDFLNECQDKHLSLKDLQNKHFKKNTIIKFRDLLIKYREVYAN